MRRIKKVIEIKGMRLEDCHLKEIKEESKKEEGNIDKDSEDDGEINADEYGDNLKLKVAYNDVKLLALRKKEIRRLKKNN